MAAFSISDSLSNLSVDDRSLCLDSGAARHMTPSSSSFTQTCPCTDTDSNIIGNGSRLPISKIGTISINTSNGQLVLNNVLLVHGPCKSLLFIHCLSKDLNYFLIFDHHGVWLKDKMTGKILTHGSNVGELFQLAKHHPKDKFAYIGVRTSPVIWHNLHGHPSQAVLQ